MRRVLECDSRHAILTKKQSCDDDATRFPSRAGHDDP